MLEQAFILWDSVLGGLLGPGSQDWRFGTIVPPTEFDAISQTTALLWIYRNVASGCVFLGFLFWFNSGKHHSRI